MLIQDPRSRIFWLARLLNHNVRKVASLEFKSSPCRSRRPKKQSLRRSACSAAARTVRRPPMVNFVGALVSWNARELRTPIAHAFIYRSLERFFLQTSRSCGSCRWSPDFQVSSSRLARCCFLRPHRVFGSLRLKLDSLLTQPTLLSPIKSSPHCLC